MRPEWILATATIVYAGFTGWIILEMRRDRKLQHMPVLDATLEKARYPDWLQFNVKNVGKGPALNCSFVCKDDAELMWKIKQSRFPVGSGETISLRFEVEEKYEKKLGEIIWLEVQYTDIFNRRYKKRIFRGRASNVVTISGWADHVI